MAALPTLSDRGLRPSVDNDAALQLIAADLDGLASDLMAAHDGEVRDATYDDIMALCEVLAGRPAVTRAGLLAKLRALRLLLSGEPLPAADDVMPHEGRLALSIAADLPRVLRLRP
jgi:hypothetical protein